ncbi:hypothetical protein K2173_014851 [Erythroxylum novogranatense]|uniref:Uncharacterized protein n=1 Tax=Erythroxylum novogranatense TaxID=1862640 RepID=A0AAV8THQ2_9ROSI|nr:hypothetical protein K2173_014851 [Erythroxylum novogranatense]
MVGQLTMTKPSRSDEVLRADQQVQISNQVKAHFDSMAPKRPTKPSRSESDAETLSTISLSIDDQTPIPELDKLRFLQSQSTVVVFSEGTNIVQDEFVETQYYKQLDSIEKQHHTTGSGFIRMVAEDNENGNGFQLTGGHGSGSSILVSGYRGNPATNDWTPCLEDDQVFVSSKPNRSESC